MTVKREIPVQYDVPIEQRPHRIHNRILLIVSFHEHSIESGDASLGKVPCTFDETSKHIQD